MKLKVREDIDFTINNPIYILKTNGDKFVYQEDEKGTTEIDVSEFFGNQETWKWGIKNDKYYGIILTALSFKLPHITLNVEPIFIGIEKDKDFTYITAVIFDDNPDRALKKAHDFKNINRQYIAFEVSGKYKKYPVKANSLETLINSILEEIREVKEISTKTFEETKKGSELSKAILEEIREVKSTITNTIPYLIKKVEELEKKIVNKEDNYQVEVLKEQGVYINGEKIYLNLLGQVFDYLDVDVISFLKFYNYPMGIKNKIKKHLDEIVRTKYLNHEAFLSYEEAERITGIKTKNKNKWRIVLDIKNTQIQKIVSLISKNIDIKSKRLEEILRNSIHQILKEKKENLTLKDLMNNATEEERKELEKIKSVAEKVLSGKSNFDIGHKAVVVSQDEILDLILHALILEVERRTNKKINIKI